MEEILRKITERLIEHERLKDIKQQREKVTKRYRENKGGAGGLVTGQAEALSYVVTRMPATLACVDKVFQSFEFDQSKSYSLLDVGFGTGAGTLGVLKNMELSEILVVEKQENMLQLGQKILSEFLDNISYKNDDILNFSTDKKYDIVLASFIFNELDTVRAKRLAQKLFDLTGEYLVIVDSGTPVVFERIQDIKSHIISRGGKIVAPCKNVVCPLLRGNDWCHFLARVRRSSMQRIAKNGTESYEDEKFTYLVFKKTGENNFGGERIIRRPKLNKGRITHTLCTNAGVLEKTFTKSQGEIYKLAKKKEVGDEI